jgi:glycosyltransferase involved in cell wall biosynthesis
MIASTQNSFSEDLVPVVISAYNHQQYEKTLQSVLDQTYPRIELIIVNDGSTDHTHDRIQDMLPEMQKRMQRVEYRNKANEGVIRSLNLCLSLAKGQYVYFIASDDVAKPEAIEFNNDDEKRRPAVADRFNLKIRHILEQLCFTKPLVTDCLHLVSPFGQGQRGIHKRPLGAAKPLCQHDLSNSHPDNMPVQQDIFNKLLPTRPFSYTFPSENRGGLNWGLFVDFMGAQSF